MLIRGSYYRSGDSVLFQAEVADVASGRVLKVLRSGRCTGRACHRRPRGLRERIAGGLSPLVNVLNRGNPVDPDLVLPQSLAAYREFVAGLKARKLDDWEEEAEHYRRAARLDSTFVAPLIQLAYRAVAERRMLGHRFDRRGARASPGAAEPVESADHRPGARPLPGGDGGGIATARSSGIPRIPGRTSRRPTTRWRSNSPTSRGPRGRFCAGWIPSATWAGGIPRRGLASVLVADGRDLAHGGRISGRAGHHRSLARFVEHAVAAGAGACAQCPRSRARGDGPLAEHDARLGGPGRRAPTDDRRRARGARARGGRDGGCREHSRASRAAAAHRLGARAEYRLGESAARPADAASGRRSSGLSGAMPTRCPGWKRWAGSRCCSPTRPRRAGSTASWRERATAR